MKAEIFVQNYKFILKNINLIIYKWKIIGYLSQSFQNKFEKNQDIFQYPYIIGPELDNTDMAIRDKLFKIVAKKIKKIYEEFFQNGDMINATRKIKELNKVTAKIYKRNGPIEYKIQPCSRSLKNENIDQNKSLKIIKNKYQLIE